MPRKSPSTITKKKATQKVRREEEITITFNAVNARKLGLSGPQEVSLIPIAQLDPESLVVVEDGADISVGYPVIIDTNRFRLKYKGSSSKVFLYSKITILGEMPPVWPDFIYLPMDLDLEIDPFGQDFID